MPLAIGMLLYPNLTQLDLSGPFEVLSRLSDTTVHLVWKTMAPVRSDSGLSILPTVTIADCPPLDVILAPGGPGQVALMDDELILDFLTRRGAQARYVTSVCTGSLLLGAAGLLRGYKATCHWMSHDQLAAFGAEPVRARVVVDRNRITGGGVTAGIDFGLQVAAMLRGDEEAKRIQLQLEYDPAPPFQAGSPETAGPELEAAIRERSRSLLTARRAATLRAKARLGL
jgi:cyclohexyl-isocyanide hydratase